MKVYMEPEELPWILLRARAAFLSREIIDVHSGEPCLLYYKDEKINFEAEVNVINVEIKRVSELNDYDAASLGYGTVKVCKTERALSEEDELVMIVRFVL